MAFLRLEDFLDNACHQLSLSLVPQGLLFAQVPPPPGPCPLTSWAPGSVNVRGALEIVPRPAPNPQRVETEAPREELSRDERFPATL